MFKWISGVPGQASGRAALAGRAACRIFACASILACAHLPAALAQAPAHLPQPTDLGAAAAAAASEGRPLLVLFSETGCQFCERLRRDYLLPMQRNAGYQKKVMFFQVDVDLKTPLRDFSGRASTQAELARHYRIRIMPTVLLLGPQGEVLAEPLVAYQSRDFYGAYIDERINTALAALRARGKPGGR